MLSDPEEKEGVWCWRSTLWPPQGRVHRVQHVALRVSRGLQESGRAVPPAAPGPPPPAALLVCGRPPCSSAAGGRGAQREGAAARRSQRSLSTTQQCQLYLLSWHFTLLYIRWGFFVLQIGVLWAVHRPTPPGLTPRASWDSWLHWLLSNSPRLRQWV